MAKKKKRLNRPPNHGDLERVLQNELKMVMPNVIWQTDDGTYQVFNRYRITPEEHCYLVFRENLMIGEFHSTRTALGWCIADKFGKPRLARELLTLDNQLQRLKTDIHARTAAATKSNNVNFREAVITKLETKIIRKKQIEFEINKCITTARSCQNQGFNNETIRTGRKTPNR